ncbi:MAG: PA2169 family four-helix-bundle protein [Candidatus Omnitrophota bacterium]
MMDKGEVVEHLNDLINLDIDASNSYLQAVEKIDDTSIQEQMLTFREEHERHIDSLNGELQKMGEKPSKRTKDFKGYLMEGFTALRSASGTSGALEAMKQNEKLVNKKYKEAVKWEVPEEVHRIIQENYEDVQEHLMYINIKLDEIK